MFSVVAAFAAVAASQNQASYQNQFMQSGFPANQQSLNNAANQTWVPDVKPLPLPKLWHGESIAADDKGRITQHTLHSSIEYEGQEYHVQTAVSVHPLELNFDQGLDWIRQQHEGQLRVELEKAIQRSIEASMRNELVNQLMKNYKPD